MSAGLLVPEQRLCFQKIAGLKTFRKRAIDRFEEPACGGAITGRYKQPRVAQLCTQFERFRSDAASQLNRFPEVAARRFVVAHRHPELTAKTNRLRPLDEF